jgi:hypothetical protein
MTGVRSCRNRATFEQFALARIVSSRSLPSLRFALFVLREVQPNYPNDRFWDFEIEAQWGDQSAVFTVECKSVFTPKAFQQTLNRCRVARFA